MKLAISLFVFCLFAVFSVRLKNELRKERSPLDTLPLGVLAPAFSLPTRNATVVNFESGPQEAKLTVINFWASWCGPCRMEMPTLEKIFAEKQQEGFLILAISEDRERGELEAYLTKKPVPFPVLLDQDGSIAEKYGIRAYPTSVLVNQKGEVVQVIEGVDLYFESTIDEHLSGRISVISNGRVVEVPAPSKEGVDK